MTNRIVHLWQRRKGSRHTGTGDDAGFEDRLRPHIDPLYRLAWRWCGDPQEAEELLQAVLCKLYPRREELAGIDRLRPWLARVLYRQFVDELRRRGQQPDSLDQLMDEQALEPEATGPGGQPADPEGVFEAELTVDRLDRALRQLPDPQRVLLIMHDVEGYTLEEIGAVMETPLGTLKSRLHRAREKYRRILAGDGTFSGSRPCNTAEDRE